MVLEAISFSKCNSWFPIICLSEEEIQNPDYISISNVFKLPLHYILLSTITNSLLYLSSYVIATRHLNTQILTY